MKERQRRLIEVYEHLRKHYGVHTKTGFAEAVKYGRTSMSSAMNGNDLYLTDGLFRSICLAYPNVFNLDYLLTGEGSLLLSSANEPSRFRYPSASPSMGMVSEDTPSPSVSPSPSPSEPLPLWADTMIHILSKQIAEIEALHSELRHSIAEVKDLKNQLSRLLESLSQNNPK